MRKRFSYAIRDAYRSRAIEIIVIFQDRRSLCLASTLTFDRITVSSWTTTFGRIELRIRIHGRFGIFSCESQRWRCGPWRRFLVGVITIDLLNKMMSEGTVMNRGTTNLDEVLLGHVLFVHYIVALPMSTTNHLHILFEFRSLI